MRLYERLTFNVKVEPLSTFTLNASRSHNLLYFIYARKASQMLLRNLRKIYATVEIHLNPYIPLFKIFNIFSVLEYSVCS